MNKDLNEIQKKKAGFDASLILIILAVVVGFGIVSPDYMGITIFIGLCVYLILKNSSKKNTKLFWLSIIALNLGGFAGSVLYENKSNLRSAWVHLKLTNAEAEIIQNQNIKNHIQFMYASQPSIPNGDLTSIVASTGGLTGWMPDAPMDSLANERVRQSMSRLSYDAKQEVILDQGGAKLKVVAKNGQVTVIRSK